MSGPFDGWLGVLAFGTALGCGLIAGVFFAFSTFVMPVVIVQARRPVRPGRQPALGIAGPRASARGP